MRVAASALIGLILLLLPVATTVAGAQQGPAKYPDLYLNVGQANNTIVAETVFYRLVVNATTCAPIAYYAKLPSGATINMTGTPGGIAVIYSNSTVNSTLVEWGKVTIVNVGNDTKMIYCENPLNAPSNLTARIVLSKYYPFIDVIVEPAAGSVSVGFILDSNLNWSAAVSYYKGASLISEAVEDSGTILYGPIDSYSLLSAKTEPDNKTVLLLAALHPLPGYTTPFSIGLYNASAVNATGILATVNYAFEGGDRGLIGVRITLTVYSAYAAATSGAVNSIAVVHPAVVDDVKALAFYESLVEDLNKTISTLRENIRKLAEENDNLTKKLEEYKGCESTWKSEVEVLKQRCDRLESTVKSAGIRTVGAFGAGIVLGLIGGLFAVGGKVRRIRR